VRGLEREISKLSRKGVKEIVSEKIKKIDITKDNLNNYLGVKKFKLVKLRIKIWLVL
jgi:ATP-dependent Lon protease